MSSKSMRQNCIYAKKDNDAPQWHKIAMITGMTNGTDYYHFDYCNSDLDKNCTMPHSGTLHDLNNCHSLVNSYRSYRGLPQICSTPPERGIKRALSVNQDDNIESNSIELKSDEILRKLRRPKLKATTKNLARHEKTSRKGVSPTAYDCSDKDKTYW